MECPPDTEEQFKSISFPVITQVEEANKILDTIFSDKNPIIGIDTEAAVEMSKHGLLCLIQISYKDQVYLFDMISMNIHKLKLQKVCHIFNNISFFIVKI
jgi:ribonuclease D